MSPAREARNRRQVRLLLLDRTSGLLSDKLPSDLVELLDPGDVLVLNDAATLPASLSARGPNGEPLELRLAAQSARGFWAVLFGAGDWRQRTEDRPPPPELPLGTRLELEGFSAQIVARSPISPRLIEIEPNLAGDELVHAIFTHGRPIQYSYHLRPLPLWEVQTVYAGRPMAFEMPSAGRPLTWSTLLALKARGVIVASITHAAGLSSTGDVGLDAALPLPERYEVPEATVLAIRAAQRSGRRVVAVGTSVVRALEGAAAANGGVLLAGAGVTTLKLGPGSKLSVVSDLLTGMHVPEESHYALLQAFVEPELLARATEHADRAGYLSHEFGDLTLVRRAAQQA